MVLAVGGRIGVRTAPGGDFFVPGVAAGGGFWPGVLVGIAISIDDNFLPGVIAAGFLSSWTAEGVFPGRLTII